MNKYPDLPYAVSYGNVLKLDDFIYCVGGAVDGIYITNKVYRINLKDINSGWQEVTSKAENRCDFGATLYNGCLVVAGGICRAKTALYQPSLNQWSSIASLNRSRDELILIAAHEKLFAIGGSSARHNCLSSVEQLSSVDGKWKEVKSMNTRRMKFAAVFYINFIYA